MLEGALERNLPDSDTKKAAGLMSSALSLTLPVLSLVGAVTQISFSTLQFLKRAPQGCSTMAMAKLSACVAAAGKRRRCRTGPSYIRYYGFGCISAVQVTYLHRIRL